jgi:hypothetical protein
MIAMANTSILDLPDSKAVFKDLGNKLASAFGQYPNRPAPIVSALFRDAGLESVLQVEISNPEYGMPQCIPRLIIAEATPADRGAIRVRLMNGVPFAIVTDSVEEAHSLIVEHAIKRKTELWP